MKKKGETLVRIADELKGTKTDNYFSINKNHMPQMAGKIFKVDKTPDYIRSCREIRIYSNEAGTTFIFHTSDLTILSGETTPLPKPKTFDPKKLFI